MFTNLLLASKILVFKLFPYCIWWDSGKGICVWHMIWIIGFYVQHFDCGILTPSPTPRGLCIYLQKGILVSVCPHMWSIRAGRCLVTSSSCHATLAEAHHIHIQVLWDITSHRIWAAVETDLYQTMVKSGLHSYMYLLYKMYACYCMSKWCWLINN